MRKKAAKSAPASGVDRQRGPRRPIALPQRLWDIIDEDAARCRRSPVKQVEAILTIHYGLDDVEIDKERLKDVPP